MIHKCKYCDYESPYRPNMRRHEKSKHGAQEPSSHQHANANQSGIGVKSIPLNWFMAQHPHGYEYAEESRAPTKKSYGPDYHSAPTKISVGPNEPMPPTTISVPPVREHVQHGDGVTIKIDHEDDTDIYIYIYISIIIYKKGKCIRGTLGVHLASSSGRFLQ